MKATRSSVSAGAPDEAQGPQVEWINLMGIKLSALNLELACATILTAIAKGQRGYICVRDAHGVVKAQQDPVLRRAHNRAFLVTPDGMPLVWALRLAGKPKVGRVYGPDLMAALFAAGQAEGQGQGVSHFLYGTTPETLVQLETNLLRRFPKARVVGKLSPPFRPLSHDEETAIAAEINLSGADIVWVGLSTPKQELWMQSMRARLTPSMLIGVGAAFDFHAGQKAQAPRFLQRSGLEWAFRLACEPRRLWRRYAVTIPSFLGLALAQAMGLKRFPLDDEPSA